MLAKEAPDKSFESEEILADLTAIKLQVTNLERKISSLKGIK